MANTGLQQALQSVVQSLQWTYSLLWQLCSQQGVLVWGDGYYNGAIKTRKTVQPTEVSTEEAALHRSRQLRELYDSLSAGEGGGGQQQQQQSSPAPVRRPCAALSPEDLTESEWFYLMCVSYSFPPGVGLPGAAFARRRYIWLTGANEADSKVFSRAILAKSAGIQTVVCIPLTDGVLELGTTEKVEEDIGLIQNARSVFMDHQDIHMMPALSEQSTSNPIAQSRQSMFQLQRHADIGQINVDPNVHKPELDQECDERENNDCNDDDYDDDNDAEAASGSETDTIRHNPGNSNQQVPLNNTGHSELMQLEMSEGVRVGSPEDCSNNLDEFQILVACQNNDGQPDLLEQDEPYHSWHFLQEDLSSGYPQPSAAEDQDMSPENAHYSETVSTILQYNMSRQTDSNINSYLELSNQSSFSRWNSAGTDLPEMLSEGTPQRMLKNILFNVPNIHCKYKEGQSPKSRYGEGANRFQKGTLQEELSASHVLAERRRREKLNERFIILRSLVPFVTKMDKASILGDTIEYVKQLRKHIQDLESRTRQIEADWRLKGVEIEKSTTSKEKTFQNTCGSPRTSTANKKASLFDKQQLQALEGSSSTGNLSRAVDSPSTDVQVSIIERDALLELQCPYREGLLLKIMQKLQELWLEVTSVQSSSANGILLAELRAKVKEAPGRKASIIEVKRAIHRILSVN